ncbi:MAG: DUF4019 domain-containing protein [Pyrinomonadaceae bacterium]
MKQPRQESTLWSALTCQRFGRSRLVAAMAQMNRAKDRGVKPPKAKAVTGHRTPKRYALLFLVALSGLACATNQGRRSLPPEVESAIGRINDEIAAERYDKIYNDASELWRQDATIEESIATFKALRTKLGPVENRTLQSATEQQNSGGMMKGRAFIVSYRTKFQNGEGMETFTLVERDGRWLLARYFVNSTALK